MINHIYAHPYTFVKISGEWWLRDPEWDADPRLSDSIGDPVYYPLSDTELALIGQLVGKEIKITPSRQQLHAAINQAERGDTITIIHKSP